ncbi:MAG: hypothetical protein ACRDTC_15990 [Pseudonocardiaceae bacterium]
MTSTSVLAAMLTELGWKPETLARRLNGFAALHGRVERMHVKTPYKWLLGVRPRSPWPALTAALLTGELGRPVTAAELGWGGAGVEAVSAISGLVLPWTVARSHPKRPFSLSGRRIGPQWRRRVCIRSGCAGR